MDTEPNGQLLQAIKTQWDKVLTGKRSIESLIDAFIDAGVTPNDRQTIFRFIDTDAVPIDTGMSAENIYYQLVGAYQTRRKEVDRKQREAEVNREIDDIQDILQNIESNREAGTLTLDALKKPLDAIRQHVTRGLNTLTKRGAGKPLDKYLQEKHDRDLQRKPGEPLGYRVPGFRELTDHIDGLQPGLYIIGAETNVGKTAFLCSLFWSLLKGTDLTGFYFSLDDGKDIIINRLLAIETGIFLNQVQKPKEHNNQAKIQAAYDTLGAYATEDRLVLLDIGDIESIDEIEREITQRLHTDSNVFVMIDGLHNLDAGGENQWDTRRMNEERANQLKAMVDTHRIPVIATAELRKRNKAEKRNDPPTLDDVKETGKYAYNANLVWLLYPEDMDAYNTTEEPTMKLQYAKNKLSHFRGTQDMTFSRAKSRITEREKAEETKEKPQSTLSPGDDV